MPVLFGIISLGYLVIYGLIIVFKSKMDGFIIPNY